MHTQSVVEGLEETEVGCAAGFVGEQGGEDVEGGVEEELVFEEVARVGREEGDVEGVVVAADDAYAGYGGCASLHCRKDVEGCVTISCLCLFWLSCSRMSMARVKLTRLPRMLIMQILMSTFSQSVHQQ